MHCQRQAMASVNVDDIEACAARAQRRRSMPAAIATNIGFGHAASLRRGVARGIRDVAWRDRGFARVEIRGAHACMDQFYRSQRTGFVNGFRHESERRYSSV